MTRVDTIDPLQKVALAQSAAAKSPTREARVLYLAIARVELARIEEYVQRLASLQAELEGATAPVDCEVIG
jgi:hypothetical protein